MIKIIFGIIIGVVIMYFVYELIMLLGKLARKADENKENAQNTKDELWRKNLEIERLKSKLESVKETNTKTTTRRKR